MNAIKNFFANFNISTHTISGAVVGAVTTYLTVPPVKDYVDGMLAGHKNLSALFLAVVAIVLKYSGSHSTQGVVNIVANTPPQQIATAVTAVKEANVSTATVSPDLQNVVAAAAASPVAQPPTPPVPPA